MFCLILKHFNIVKDLRRIKELIKLQYPVYPVSSGWIRGNFGPLKSVKYKYSALFSERVMYLKEEQPLFYFSSCSSNGTVVMPKYGTK